MGPVSHVFCATAQGRLAKLMSRKTHVSTPIYFSMLYLRIFLMVRFKVRAFW